ERHARAAGDPVASSVRIDDARAPADVDGSKTNARSLIMPSPLMSDATRGVNRGPDVAWRTVVTYTTSRSGKSAQRRSTVWRDGCGCPPHVTANGSPAVLTNPRYCSRTSSSVYVRSHLKRRFAVIGLRSTFSSRE